ncbi:MAG: M24 family metallopeptidase [Acidobacteriota bacterium]
MREILTAKKCDGIMITVPANVHYLSGFSGEGTLVVTTEKQVLYTDTRYIEQAESESPDFEARIFSEDDLKAFTDRLSKVGFESHHITYLEYQKYFKSMGNRLVPQPHVIEELRMIKDETEIAKIREAVRIGDAVFDSILAHLVPGTPERDIALTIEHMLKTKGCEREAFDTIVVSGKRSSMPHGRPSGKELEKGDLVTMDFGGFYQRYAGDMTRTVAIDKACSKSRDIYSRVLEAQMEAVAAVAPGKTCREIDEVARGFLKKHELAEYFAHSTGHGLGLEVHELPTVSARSDTVLTENMVITVEPGVYIRDWGGVRIEDVVLVKGSGHEVLTGSSKDLMAL